MPMILPKEYKEFYGILFESIEAEYGKMDSESIVAIVGFDAGGPLNLSKIEDRGLYVSCELCCRDDQLPSSFGNYELMVVGPNTEMWARSIMTDIARMSLESKFNHENTLNYSNWVKADETIKGVIFEKYSSIEYNGNKYGIMRVIGVTEPELKLCYEQGTKVCLKHLKDSGIYPKTVLGRKST